MAVLRTHSAEAVPSPAGSAGTIQTMGGVTRDFQQGGYGPEGVPATESQFSNPRGLGFAPDGDLYIGDTLNGRVRRIDANGFVNLVAGAGALSEPHGVAVDSLGNVYIADTGNCVIRKVSSSGAMTQFAGTGFKSGVGTVCVKTPGSPDGPALEVALDRPTSLFMTRAGGTDTLWIADTGNSQIRKIDVVVGGGAVANPQSLRVAGGNTPTYYSEGSGRDALDAEFRHPENVWVADDGTLYVSDTGNNLIRKIAPANSYGIRNVSVIAGDVAAAEANADSVADVAGHSDGDGGHATAAACDRPTGLTGDNQGHLYVAEEHGSRIRRINLGSGIIDTVAGDGTILEQRTNGGSLAIKGENGPALETQFARLGDIQVNPADGSLWIADSRHNRIRAIADPANAPGAIVPTGGGSSTPLPTTTTTAPKATTTTTTTTTGPAAPPPATGGPAGDPVVSGSNTGAPVVRRSGYWMVGSDGIVYPFGDARHHGNAATTSAVDLEPTPSGNGYWVVDDLGRVSRFGDAVFHGHVEASKLVAGEKITSLSATTDGGGYWIFTSRGRVLTFGNAAFLGDVSDLKLAGPVLDSIVTPSGQGYYMVASDGGTFSFGDAKFHGSMGGRNLNAPVQSLVPDSDGVGYWLVASDGGIFAFDAGFKGSMGNTKLNKPVTGMVRAGNGYLMVGEDGGIFDFSGTPDGFQGSLGATPPTKPITSVAVREAR
jgi:sugar lactone lactonase YvrE